MNKPASNAARQAKLRADRKAKGYIRREYYATDIEHGKLKASLARPWRPGMLQALL